jgi:hypothetical protein
LKWTTAPFPSDAADDDAVKKATADDEKQYASLISTVMGIKWNVQKSNLVQVEIFVIFRILENTLLNFH